MAKDIYNRVFRYHNGRLIWNEKISRNTVVGKPAPTKAGKNVYLRVTLFGKTEYQHRVIWVMHYGEIPEGLEVDHKDRDKTNNRIDNLRLVNSAGNKWNVSAKGYYYCVDRGVYRSRITTKGKTKYLGSFTTEKEAHEAFLDAQKERENH